MITQGNIRSDDDMAETPLVHNKALLIWGWTNCEKTTKSIVKE